MFFAPLVEMELVTTAVVETRSSGIATNPTTALFRSIELFTGAGGLALGSHLSRFEHQALIECNGPACETLAANAEHNSVPGINHWKVVRGDVREVVFSTFGHIDLVAGGPPCQPFSIGGKARGMEDTRDMIPQFVRAVRELHPSAFVLENVKGLMRPMFKPYFSYVILQLTHPTVPRRQEESWEDHLRRLEDVHTSGSDSDLRYNVIFRLLNAADYGVPQTRERVFVVGFRGDLGIEWHFPAPTHSRDALTHTQSRTGEYWERHGILPDPPALLDRWKQKGGKADLENSIKPWRTVRDAICDLPEPFKDIDDRDCVTNHLFRPGARSYPGHTGSLLDWPSKTLKAGDHGVPGGENMIAFANGSVRYFTVREAARIQTFPDSWHFEGPWSEAMRQLGNAVPVLLANRITSSLADALRGNNVFCAANSTRI
jgi:DNA (cytosine-5)-methyltransferase 1